MLESYIQQQKQNKKALLMPYLTAGDGGMENLSDILIAYQEAGSDLLEVGIPFSDPSADGPTIQAACQRSLKGGFTLEKMFEQINIARHKGLTIPLILFGYLNPFLQFGMEKLAALAADCGVRGLLILDLPPEQSDPMKEFLHQKELELIYLVAPTTSQERRKLIFKKAGGFIYCVARAGITGQKTDFDTNYLQTIQKESPVPVAVGFGVQDAKQTNQLKNFGDIIVVGSALVDSLHQRGIKQTQAYIKELNQPFLN